MAKRSVIAADQRNTAAISRLRREIEGPLGIVPFVGAGLSVSWGFPNWRDFLMMQAHDADVVHGVQDDLAQGKYEHAAQRIIASLGERRWNHAVKDTFGEHRMHIPVGLDATKMLPNLASGPVITTNFDRVLSKVFRDAGKAFDLELWGAKVRLAADSLAEDYHILLKLHGDVDDSADRIITAKEYRRHYGRSTLSSNSSQLPLPRLLEHLFSTRSILFLGCSLHSDRYLHYLQNSASEVSREHFAIVEAPSSAYELQQRTTFLTDHGVIPIWYPAGAHHQIAPFLNHLAVHVRPADDGRATVPVSLAIHNPNGIPSRSKARARRQKERQQLQQLMKIWQSALTEDEQLRFIQRYGPFFYNGGFWREYIAVATRAAEAACQVQRNIDAAEIYNNLSLVYKRIGSRRQAHQTLARAASLLKAIPPCDLHVVVLHNQALERYDEGRFTEATELFKAALQLAKKVKDLRLEPIWRLLGQCLAMIGDTSTGVRYIRRALLNSRSKRDELGEVRALLALSSVYDEGSRWKKMHDILLQAVPLVTGVHGERDIQATAQVLDNLGVALHHMGKFQESLAYYLQALWYEQEADDRPGIPSTLMNIAWLHYDGIRQSHLVAHDEQRKRLAAYLRSSDYYGQALSYAQAEGDKLQVADVLIQKSLPTAALGEPQKALAELDIATRIVRRKSAYSLLALALCNRGLIRSVYLNQPARALRSFHAGIKWATKCSLLGLQRNLLVNLADALKRLNRLREAHVVTQKVRILEKQIPSSRRRKLS